MIMICVPIVQWIGGARAHHIGVMAGMIGQFFVTLAILREGWTWWQIGRLFFFIAPLSLLIEAIGTHTGYPFGTYFYTDKLQPQLYQVPLLIPLAWFMLLSCAWAVAWRWHTRPLIFAIVAGVAVMAWDLFLDPQMVAWGYWVWPNGGSYFGIPLLNFLGWWLTGTVLTLIVWPIFPKTPPPLLLLLFLYAVIWFLESFGLAFFWQMPQQAVIGGLVMGSLLLIGWHNRHFWPPSWQQLER